MKRLSAFVPLGLAAGLFLTTDCMNKRQLHTKDNVLNSRTEKNADDIRVLKSQNEELFDRINLRLDGIEIQVLEIREMVRELNIQIDRELENEEDLEMESCNVNIESVNINKDVQDDSSIEDPVDPQDQVDAEEEYFEDVENTGDQDLDETEFIETPHK
ncbi:hypothetical protein HOJ01_00315 [bacterium]|jgi:hypothetical protein|nr:hypothetical protein [bacterium]MBT6293231.1 hypothetical protein [bacterium]